MGRGTRMPPMGWGWCWPREAVTRARWFDFRWWLTWLATSAAIWKKCLVGVCGDSCEIFVSRRSDGIAEICNRGWGGSEHVWGVNARRGRREGGVQGPEIVGASTDMCWLWVDRFRTSESGYRMLTLRGRRSRRRSRRFWGGRHRTTWRWWAALAPKDIGASAALALQLSDFDCFTPGRGSAP